MIGGRTALAIVRFGTGTVTSPTIEAIRGGAPIGTVALAAPASLPTSEGGGATYASDAWTADLPSGWITPGTSFRITAANYSPSQPVVPVIGANSSMALRVLPFYLFGANETNTQPLSVTQRPSDAVKRELLAKWPLASLNVATHGVGYVSWDRLIVAPNGSRPAYLMTNADQEKAGFEELGAVLGIIGKLRAANGEDNTDNQYYAALLPLDAAGKYKSPGGGLGTIGGGTGTGTYTYTGIFFHEQGHAFGLPHAADGYADGAYPYVAGSLKGSAWGYDFGTRQFLSPLIPTTASSYKNCATNHQLDGSGRCYKQDPMQSGSGDQDPSYLFADLSDYNAARIQLWLEGVTATDANGAFTYSGGRIFVEPNGYSRWNSITQTRVPLPDGDNTVSSGLYGINYNLPTQRDVPVYAIIVGFSRAGTVGASYIYAPLRFTGNLIRTFDPTNSQDLADINIGSGKYKWYCQSNGCDYTVRVTYADGSVAHQVLKSAFRTWFKSDQAEPGTATDPNLGDSFRNWAINVPAGQAIRKIELLDTPMVWKGMPADPKVLLTR
ncbi:M66 family metalloprotease [Sphingomonas sp. R86520]|uniref:M66 family metalloprotease n=1 Tax=Sphingomonas sp. R86520 TaxID=3093859 RepID=UPI0036D4046E